MKIVSQIFYTHPHQDTMQQSIWGEINPEAGHLCLGLLRQQAGQDQYPSDVWKIIIGYTFDRFHDLTNQEYVDKTSGITTAPSLANQQSSCAACGATLMISPHPFVVGWSIDGNGNESIQKFCSVYSMLADGFNFNYSPDIPQYEELDRAFIKTCRRDVSIRIMAIQDGRMQNYWRLRQAQLTEGQEIRGPVDGTTRRDIFMKCHAYAEIDPETKRVRKDMIHRSFQQTREVIAESCWWLGLSDEVRGLIIQCEHCNNTHHSSKRKRRGTMESPILID